MSQTLLIRRNLIIIIMAALCLPLLLLSGCAGQQAEDPTANMPDPISIEVLQIDRRDKIGSKTADGQYLLANLRIKNLTNETITLQPSDIKLRHVSDEEEEQFTQPLEKQMSYEVSREMGNANLKEKVLDFQPANLYPQLDVERYVVFMVPDKARLDEYEVMYEPAQTAGFLGGGSAPVKTVTTPLATEATVVNDHRHYSPY